jgi:hypothetical protein
MFTPSIIISVRTATVLLMTLQALSARGVAKPEEFSTLGAAHDELQATLGAALIRMKQNSETVPSDMEQLRLALEPNNIIQFPTPPNKVA